MINFTLKYILENKTNIQKLEDKICDKIAPLVKNTDIKLFSSIGISIVLICSLFPILTGNLFLIPFLLLTSASWIFIPWGLFVFINSIKKPNNRYFDIFKDSILFNKKNITALQNIKDYLGYSELNILSNLKSYSSNNKIFVSLILEKIESSSYEEIQESMELLEECYLKDIKTPNQINKIQYKINNKIKEFERILKIKPISFKKGNLKANHNNKNKIMIKEI